jgi:type I restriction enzyme R subunit
MSGEARELFAAFLPDGDLRRYAAELAERLRRDFTAEMQLLRDQSFQGLLISYPRPPKSFTIGYDVQDTVTSQFLIKGADGREYKPEDYLVAFARFVRENPDHIEAIRVLLDRPREWSTDALAELKNKLTRAPQRFTVDNLERVHREHYGKALVDIISMVKHAADEKQPLLTAEERVRLAVVKVSAGRDLSGEQRAWLERIREHLVQNLSISKDDFESVPVLDRAGGWGVADRAFQGQLESMIQQLNEAVAA